MFWLIYLILLKSLKRIIKIFDNKKSFVYTHSITYFEKTSQIAFKKIQKPLILIFNVHFCYFFHFFVFTELKYLLSDWQFCGSLTRLWFPNKLVIIIIIKMLTKLKGLRNHTISKNKKINHANKPFSSTNSQSKWSSSVFSKQDSQRSVPSSFLIFK